MHCCNCTKHHAPDEPCATEPTKWDHYDDIITRIADIKETVACHDWCGADTLLDEAAEAIRTLLPYAAEADAKPDKSQSCELCEVNTREVERLKAVLEAACDADDGGVPCLMCEHLYVCEWHGIKECRAQPDCEGCTGPLWPHFKRKDGEG